MSLLISPVEGGERLGEDSDEGSNSKTPHQHNKRGVVLGQADFPEWLMQIDGGGDDSDEDGRNTNPYKHVRLRKSVQILYSALLCMYHLPTLCSHTPYLKMCFSISCLWIQRRALWCLAVRVRKQLETPGNVYVYSFSFHPPHVHTHVYVFLCTAVPDEYDPSARKVPRLHSSLPLLCEYTLLRTHMKRRAPVLLCLGASFATNRLRRTNRRSSARA